VNIVRLLIPTLVFPLALVAQEAPPAELIADEVQRSHTCVPALATLDALEADLEPLGARAERLQALARAVTVEDPDRAAPFDDSGLERAVREWFEDDAALAQRYLEEGDEALQEERAEGRRQIQLRITEELEALSASVQERIGQDEEAQMAFRECDDVIFVRSAVLEACDGVDSPLCDAARDSDGDDRFRFVDAPEDLWDVEQMRPWTSPSRLGRMQDGSIAGSRTSTLVRRGNLSLILTVEPMIRERESISAEEEAEFDANLDSLGLLFDNPEFVMAPALSIFFDVAEPVAGETDYLLHFGDLSDPENQIIWSIPAGEGGVVQASAPAPGWALGRLAGGEPVSFTAVTLAENEEEVDGEIIFSLGVTPVGQASAVQELLAYWEDGQLARDLESLIPAEEPSSPPDGS